MQMQTMDILVVVNYSLSHLNNKELDGKMKLKEENVLVTGSDR
jgi:hypothetical protein